MEYVGDQKNVKREAHRPGGIKMKVIELLSATVGSNCLVP